MHKYYEVKAVNGMITQGSSAAQGYGMVIALSKLVAQGKPSPSLTFYTTSNTKISPLLVDLATNKGVALFQAKAITASNGTETGIAFTLPKPLNPKNYVSIPMGYGTAVYAFNFPTGIPDTGPDYEEIVP